jgi:hypothetical protein
MISINKKFSVAILSLVILLVAVSSADAQRWRRNRDNGISNKEKAAWIGGGAAAGAVIGGLLNGKKGAIIGGLLGAGAGTATSVIKDRNDDDDRYGRYNRRYVTRNDRYGSYNNRSYFVNDGYSRFGNNNRRFSNNRRCR